MSGEHNTTAADICEALRLRHSEDLYAEEVCVQGMATARLDAWAASRSWKVETIGYEIKVSRGDWLQDRKLHVYRDYVDRMWVVCPWGLIAVAEVPVECGLLWLTKTGSRLLRRKPAPALTPTKRDLCVWSVLINRASVKARGRASASRDREEMLQEFVQDKERRGRLAISVGGAVREMAEELEGARWKLRALDRLDEKARAAGFVDAESAIGAARVGAGCDPIEVARHLARIESATAFARQQLVPAPREEAAHVR